MGGGENRAWESYIGGTRQYVPVIIVFWSWGWFLAGRRGLLG